MTFLTMLRKSITSFRFYREIAFQRISKSMGYLCLFLLLVTLALSMKLSTLLIQGMGELSKEIGDKLPEIRIENGVLSIDAPEPFIIEEEEDFILIIDTTGETTTIDPPCKQGILLTKNKLFYKQSAMETREYDLSKIKSFTLDKAAFKRWKETFSRLAFPILLVTLYPYFIMVKLIQILFFTLIAGMISTTAKANLKYENLFNISLFALTPPVLLATIFILAGLRVPLFYLLYIILYLVFLTGGVKSCRD